MLRLKVNLCGGEHVYLVVLNSLAATRLLESPAGVTSLDDFETIFEAHYASLFCFALSYLRDRDEAQSVTQDCFLKAHRSIGSYRGEASLHTWLMAILVNLIHDRSRNVRWRFWSQTRSTAKAIEDIQHRDLQPTPEKQSLLRE